MAPGDAPDPVRATMLAILQQLNRAESMHEGRERDQALALGDIERLLNRFWATEREAVRVPQVLGLLVRNGLVRAHATSGPRAHATSAARSPTAHYYRITVEGKQFLVEALAKTDRIA
ncbi:MAG TPA: hypothetical protein VML94_06145 [Thermoplasmata archaeon]|nr:hypothetical protein [Thermoplasmata archaeon]